MRLSTQIIAFVIACTLAACGISGGSSQPDRSDSNAVLGERRLPGYAVRATRMSTDANGAITVRIRVLAEPGQSAPLVVTCWISSDYDPSAVGIPARPVGDAADQFDVLLEVPRPLPSDAAVWVRLVLADGSVLEAGRASFPF